MTSLAPSPTARAITGRTIVCVSSLDWDAHWTSKQNLMALLAQENDVVYVEPPRTLRHAGRAAEHGYGRAAHPPRLEVVRPLPCSAARPAWRSVRGGST